MIEFVRELSEMEASVAHYEPSEADLRERLVRPVLAEWLAFPQTCIHAEHTLRGQRPDYVCRVDTTSKTVALFVEVKALGVNLRARPSGAPTSRIPLVQLEDYLVRRPDAQTNAWGILTNGREWILLRRDGPDVSEAGTCHVDSDTNLRKLLESVTHRALTRAPVDTAPFKNAWLSLLQARPADARSLLEKLGAAVSLNHVSPDEQVIPGMDVARAWVEEKSSQDTIAPATRLIVAVSQSQDGRIPMSDVRSLLDRGAHGCADALVLVGPTENDREVAVARLAVRVGGALRTTLEFDPALPSPAVRTAIQRMHAAFKIKAANRLAKLDEALNPRHLERKFFEEAGNWFASVASGKAGKEELLLLIQLLFVWLLRERGWIPEELFLPPAPSESFHEQLMTLCNKVMSTPLKKRNIRGSLWDEVPFLNGSLFRERKTQPAKLSNEDYFATGEKPGIITILRRYQWTLSEQGSRHSELAMDPSLLGALFEQLVVKAEGITPGATQKMPSGTYYTPMDLVDEMVCDALSEAVTAHVEGSVGSDIVALLHPEHVDGIYSNRWRETALCGNETLREKVGATLKQLTVLDPCTGSGAFIVGVLNALRRAARRLEGKNYDDARRVRNAVEQQLFAIDKMPIAVQIARLRLFIAIVDGLDPRCGNPPPLPNLEVRITSADMLATSVSKEQLGLFEYDAAFNATLNQFTQNRQNYVNSDKPEDKEQRIIEDNRLRKILSEQLDLHSGLVTDQAAFLNWLEAGILENDEQTAELDPKLLFQQPKGWDVVIGNPPYQKPTKKEKSLVKARDYKTITANDLYTLCTEAAFALAKETTGIVTFVVPNSITFADAKQCLRELIDNKAQRLLVRTYDNRPKPVFPPHPFIKGGDRGAESRQRVSIITARIGISRIERHCTGYIRLAAATRTEQLRWRPQEVIGVDMNGAWAHVPTQELAELLKVMRGKVKNQTQMTVTSVLTFPATCFRFISCVPKNVLDNESRRGHAVPEDRDMAWLSLYNSHLFYAYWLMTGDAFHLLQDDICNIQEPRGWDVPEILDKAIEAGSALTKPEVVKACRKDFIGKGGEGFPNVDFHSARPDLIDKCDHANLLAYGFEENELETLLEQMKALRMGSVTDLTPGLEGSIKLI